MIVFDHFVYLAGPAWMPMALLLPVLGAVVGALIGTFASLCGLQWIRNGGSGGWLAVPFICVTGLLVGLVVAAASVIYPPALLVTTSTTPSSDPYPIEGAPLHVDLAPTYLTFPTIGLVVGALAAVIVTMLGVRLSRTTVVEDDHNGNESPMGFHP
ncbi:hypothetical protein O4215_24995 [Rhodococcus maanshanensis]|uniref:hypothetical protein n=1 Tax=Rhodococcus maanshanensis TaxID=183556 RepID=UPI0022B3F619|nr:hypothetical protein [Rhodococcus maanshanensis]MCZ4558825.1 hypothetical protein [Rhodococcus maanshanensis]